MEKMKVKMVQKQGGLYYPQIETKEVVNVVESVVKRNCLFQRGALIGVLSVVGEEMKRLLNEGYIVEVPGVGKFYPFAIGKGVRKEEADVVPDYKLKIVYRMCK